MSNKKSEPLLKWIGGKKNYLIILFRNFQKK